MQAAPDSFSVKHTLGTRLLALPTLDPRRRHPSGHSQRLECALSPVVVILTTQAVYVQRNAGTLGEALEAVGNHLAAEVANLLAAQTEVDDGVGAVGQVNDGAREGLVEGAICASEASETGGATEGLLEGDAERDADVFGGVVVVDCGGWLAIDYHSSTMSQSRRNHGS